MSWSQPEIEDDIIQIQYWLFDFSVCSAEQQMYKRCCVWVLTWDLGFHVLVPGVTWDLLIFTLGTCWWWLYVPVLDRELLVITWDSLVLTCSWLQTCWTWPETFESFCCLLVLTWNLTCDLVFLTCSWPPICWSISDGWLMSSGF